MKIPKNNLTVIALGAFACLLIAGTVTVSARGQINTTASLPGLPQKSGVATAKLTSLLPSQFLGKTFAECEKTLGKPALIENPQEDSQEYRRFYKTSVADLTRIILTRNHVYNNKNLDPKTVNYVCYHFPKGKVKTWREACAIIGMNTVGAREADLVSPDKVEHIGDKIVAVAPPPEDKVAVEGFQGGYWGVWCPAAKSAKYPIDRQHINDNELLISNQ